MPAHSHPFVVFNPDELEAPELRRLSVLLCESAAAIAQIDNEFVRRFEDLSGQWPPENVASCRELIGQWAQIKNDAAHACSEEIRKIVGDAALPNPTRQ